jgi:nucleoid-associated protein YgaU
MTKCIPGGLIFVLLVGATSTVSAAEDKMTREDYVAKMAEYTAAEEEANKAIADCDAKIASLKSQLDALDAEINSIEGDILGLVEASQAEIGDYHNKLDALISQLEGLMALAPEEIYMHHRMELEDLAMQLAELKKNKISALPEVAPKLARIESMLNQLQDQGVRQLSQFDYTVTKGDHLWGIAEKETIYSDPYMWPRIYRANRDKIEDPDLIYPNQVLDIPVAVGANQYLVTRGDFLFKIAAAVYNDPRKWHKIYMANEKQIVEKDLIFPAQVLEIPAN